MKWVWSGRSRALIGVVASALALAGAALADREKIHLTAAGQAAARAAVVQRADFGSATGWTSTAKKPDLSGSTGCPGFQPRQSDLTVIGAAEVVWKNAGIQVDSEAQVLQTPAMVKLDWQRTVLAPQVLPCLRSNIVKHLPSSERLVSIARVSFPAVATYTRLYRTLIDVTSGSATARVLVDSLLVGHGSTEITLTTTAAYAAAPLVQAAELRLARLLVSRAVV
jgi:hypothetical protein